MCHFHEGLIRANFSAVQQAVKSIGLLYAINLFALSAYSVITLLLYATTILLMELYHFGPVCSVLSLNSPCVSSASPLRDVPAGLFYASDCYLEQVESCVPLLLI